MPDRLHATRHLEFIDDRMTFLEPAFMTWLQALCQEFPKLETRYRAKRTPRYPSSTKSGGLASKLLRI